MRIPVRPSDQFFLLLALLSVMACESKSPTGPRTDPLYPTVAAPLSPDSLASRKLEFASANPRICSSLNEYGFTGGSGLLCTTGSQGIGPDADVDQLIKIAKGTISKNWRFTGVVDSSHLELHNALLSPGILRVNFSKQMYEGFLVERTWIAALMDSVGVLSLSGNHYQDIYIPAPKISAQSAQTSILGMTLKWYDWHGLQTYVVARDDLCQEPVRVVLPEETDAGIELRVAWKIPVGCDHPRWYVYTDTMRGDSLYVYDTIIF